jgi:hypothetical protein
MKKEGFQPSLLPQEFELPKEPLPIENGAIHLIRHIRGDGVLNIFGEHFQMPQDVIHEYVVATIFTEMHSLKVTFDDEIVGCFEYKLPNKLPKMK